MRIGGVESDRDDDLLLKNGASHRDVSNAENSRPEGRHADSRQTE
jgi:hypothetical protein